MPSSDVLPRSAQTHNNSISSAEANWYNQLKPSYTLNLSVTCATTTQASNYNFSECKWDVECVVSTSAKCKARIGKRSLAMIMCDDSPPFYEHRSTVWPDPQERNQALVPASFQTCWDWSGLTLQWPHPLEPNRLLYSRWTSITYSTSS